MIDQDDIVIHPRKGRKEVSIPACGFLLVNPSEADELHNRLRNEGARSQFIFHSKLTVASDNSFFVAGPGIGSPMASMIMEKLIVLGARRIVLFGWCGAIDRNLKVGDIIVPAFAEVGEGTSQYYSDDRRQVVHQGLLETIARKLCAHGENVSHSGVWSTDAIFRESRKHLGLLNREKQIGVIDMEFSALCSVAAFRQIEFAGVLIVSDEIWGQSWRPGFTSDAFVTTKTRIIQYLLKTFTDQENNGQF